MSAPEVLTAVEVAAVLRCSPEHVATLCKRKQLVGVNLKGELGWRIHRAEVEAFVRGRKPARATSAAPTRRAAK